MTADVQRKPDSACSAIGSIATSSISARHILSTGSVTVKPAPAKVRSAERNGNGEPQNRLLNRTNEGPKPTSVHRGNVVAELDRANH